MTPELAHALTLVDATALGGRIKGARVAAGLTQPALGGADASVTYVSRIESGQRRPGPDLLATFARRLSVTVEYLVLGETWEDGRRLELQLDHAELALVGGEARTALTLAREVLAAPGLEGIVAGPERAHYVEAGALDALGDPAAVAAFETLLASDPEWSVAAKAATALSRILREQGQLQRAIDAAQSQLDRLPEDLRGSEEGIRLAVTLAASVYTIGRAEEAAEICDRAITEAERLSSPLARASAYWNASIIRADSGDLVEALSLARRALDLLETTERVRDLGRLRTQLSTIMLRTDPPRLDDARHQLRLADTELDWSEASPADKALNDIVNARALFLGGDVQARARAEAALANAGQGLPLVAVSAEVLLGQISWSEGDRSGAQERYRRAIATLTGVGADREAAQLWFEIGTLADDAGLSDEARDAYRRAAASTGLTSRLPVSPVPSVPAPAPGTAPAGR